MSHKQSALQHHFDNLEQQYEASNLGMWLFLVTEILFFGGIFLGYTVYRGQYPEAFGVASNHLSVFWGAFNTVVLLASSLTMVLAVHHARQGDTKGVHRNLMLTIFFGLVFFAVKAYEYSEKFKHHLVPGTHFQMSDFVGPGPELFYSFYFGMTGLHAFHMVIGMGMLIWLVIQNKLGKVTAEHNTYVDMFGLYWHFVDLVWIFLFPMLYLIARHG